MHTKIGLAPKTQFYEFLVIECCIFCICIFITLRILNLHNRNPKIFASHIFGLKCCFHPYMPKLSKTSSPQKLFDYDCITLCR